VCAGGSCQPGTPTDSVCGGSVCSPEICNPTATNHDTEGCIAGTPPDSCCTADTQCDDGNACTTDTCSSAGSCGHTNNTDPCSDGVSCTVGDQCANGSCHPGTPEDTICNDNNDCTTDHCVGAGGDEIGCQHIGEPITAADSRAFGIWVNLGGNHVIPATPDSDRGSPQELLGVPLPPAADVRALRVEESNSADANGADASATATTGKVRLIQQGLDSLVSADAIQAMATCHADATTGLCSSEGSTLTNVRINGSNPVEVKEPVDLKIELPGLLTAHVQLLEEVGRGANAGIPQPADNRFSSGLTVNAIHVTVTTAAGDVVTEVIVASASADVAFGNADMCEPGPRVSGRAYVIGREHKQDIVTTAQLGEVNLPPTGGVKDFAMANLGPIGDGSHEVAQSRTAASHTEGTIDPATNSASSSSYAFVEDLDLVDTGSADPTNPLLGADLVRSECTSSASPQGASSTAKSKLVGLTIGGEDVCLALGLGTTCEPAPNTPASHPGITIILNEQIPDPPASGSTGITVNAAHIFIDGLQAIGLGEIILSSSHCDASTAPSDSSRR
jgi:hypothetical protein